MTTTPVEVHKFGGASVADAEGIRRAGRLLEGRPAGHALVVVVSAMGKTTAALEAAVRDAWEGRLGDALARAAGLRDAHAAVAAELALPEEARAGVLALGAELEEALRGAAAASPGTGEAFDRAYDAVVATGERWSAGLLGAHLAGLGGDTVTHDARVLIRTDGTHREARVHAEETARALRGALEPVPGRRHVLPGFIGRSAEGHTVTLGLEGSDYTAALAAAATGAASVTLWKNVAGIHTADPALFPDAVRLPVLDYREVFQMANYGAKVVHPKTLQPLEEAGIPLRVRSFLDPDAPGTEVGARPPAEGYPPLRVRVDGLLLVSLRHGAMAYLTERHVARVFATLREHRARTYLTEIGRMTLSVAVAVDPLRRDALIADLEQTFQVRWNGRLHLLTVRHPGRAGARAPEGAVVYLEQRSRQTWQCLAGPSAEG